MYLLRSLRLCTELIQLGGSGSLATAEISFAWMLLIRRPVGGDAFIHGSHEVADCDWTDRAADMSG